MITFPGPRRVEAPRAKPRPASPRRRAQWLGSLALLAGITASGLIYWEDLRHPPTSIDELMPDADRRNRRQMGILYGTVGTLTVDLEEALRRPGTQIVLVLVASAALAGVCFRVGGSFNENDER